MVDATETAGSWDPAWEAVYRAQEWGAYPPEHVIRFVARRWYGVPDRRAVRLLDLGCGTGACVWYLAREGFAVAGIDGAPTAIERARARLAREGLAADLRTGDFQRLPWPDETFEGVIDNAALYTNRFADCRRAVAEVYRVLKPGGHFLSCNFSDRTWGYGTGEEVEPGGFRSVAEGPLARKGFCLFFGRPQIDALYRNFVVGEVNLLSWTLGNMSHRIELWIVEARKPA